MLNNAVFTWASGEEFLKLPEFGVFRESFNRLRFADMWMFSHDLPEDVERSFFDDGYWVNKLQIEIKNLLRDRWYHYWIKLQECNYDYVLICDSKDVIFQDDPFKIMNEMSVETRKTDFLLLVEEGGLHYQSEWNSQEQYKLQIDVDADWRQDYARSPILNGGFIMGTPKKLSEFCLLLWTNMLRGAQAFTDQAMINFLYNWLESDEDILTYNPNHINAPPYCLIGEGVKRDWLKHQPVMKDGKLVNHKDEPYYALHQWERTEWQDQLMEVYSA